MSRPQGRSILVRLEEAQEEERRRIAADLHDDSIQVITAADLRLAALDRMLEDPALKSEVAEIHQTLQLAVDRLRKLLFELLPPPFDREGLSTALETYVAHREPGVEFNVKDELDGEPPEEIRRTLFRMGQEAINNALKHAGATRIDVVLSSRDGGIGLLVADDGRGFDIQGLGRPALGHIGLPTMVERASLAGGWCTIDSTPGGGTTVQAWLPTAPTGPGEQPA
jgi:signal transduction histidine kinase